MKKWQPWVWGCVVCGLLSLLSPAQSQSSFSETQIDNYAGAVFEIEQKRDDVLRKAKQQPNWEKMARRADSRGIYVCDLKKEEQSSGLRQLCEDLFRYAKETIERYGFRDSREFNQITLAHQKDSQLKRRIQEKVADLSRRSGGK